MASQELVPWQPQEHTAESESLVDDPENTAIDADQARHDTLQNVASVLEQHRVNQEQKTLQVAELLTGENEKLRAELGALRGENELLRQQLASHEERLRALEGGEVPTAEAEDSAAAKELAEKQPRRVRKLTNGPTERLVLYKDGTSEWVAVDRASATPSAEQEDGRTSKADAGAAEVDQSDAYKQWIDGKIDGEGHKDVATAQAAVESRHQEEAERKRQEFVERMELSIDESPQLKRAYQLARIVAERRDRLAVSAEDGDVSRQVREDIIELDTKIEDILSGYDGELDQEVADFIIDATVNPSVEQPAAAEVAVHGDIEQASVDTDTTEPTIERSPKEVYAKKLQELLAKGALDEAETKKVAWLQDWLEADADQPTGGEAVDSGPRDGEVISSDAGETGAFAIPEGVADAELYERLNGQIAEARGVYAEHVAKERGGYLTHILQTKGPIGRLMMKIPGLRQVRAYADTLSETWNAKASEQTRDAKNAYDELAAQRESMAAQAFERQEKKRSETLAQTNFQDVLGEGDFDAGKAQSILEAFGVDGLEDLSEDVLKKRLEEVESQKDELIEKQATARVRASVGELVIAEGSERETAIREQRLEQGADRTRFTDWWVNQKGFKGKLKKGAIFFASGVAVGAVGAFVAPVLASGMIAAGVAASAGAGHRVTRRRADSAVQSGGSETISQAALDEAFAMNRDFDIAAQGGNNRSLTNATERESAAEAARNRARIKGASGAFGAGAAVGGISARFARQLFDTPNNTVTPETPTTNHPEAPTEKPVPPTETPTGGDLGGGAEYTPVHEGIVDAGGGIIKEAQQLASQAGIKANVSDIQQALTMTEKQGFDVSNLFKGATTYDMNGTSGYLGDGFASAGEGYKVSQKVFKAFMENLTNSK